MLAEDSCKPLRDDVRLLGSLPGDALRQALRITISGIAAAMRDTG